MTDQLRIDSNFISYSFQLDCSICIVLCRTRSVHLQSVASHKNNSNGVNLLLRQGKDMKVIKAKQKALLWATWRYKRFVNSQNIQFRSYKIDTSGISNSFKTVSNHFELLHHFISNRFKCFSVLYVFCIELAGTLSVEQFFPLQRKFNLSAFKSTKRGVKTTANRPVSKSSKLHAGYSNSKYLIGGKFLL